MSPCKVLKYDLYIWITKDCGLVLSLILCPHFVAALKLFIVVAACLLLRRMCSVEKPLHSSLTRKGSKGFSFILVQSHTIFVKISLLGLSMCYKWFLVIFKQKVPIRVNRMYRRMWSSDYHLQQQQTYQTGKGSGPDGPGLVKCGEPPCTPTGNHLRPG